MSIDQAHLSGYYSAFLVRLFPLFLFFFILMLFFFYFVWFQSFDIKLITNLNLTMHMKLVFFL